MATRRVVCKLITLDERSKRAMPHRASQRDALPDDDRSPITDGGRSDEKETIPRRVGPNWHQSKRSGGITRLHDSYRQRLCQWQGNSRCRRTFLAVDDIDQDVGREVSISRNERAFRVR